MARWRRSFKPGFRTVDLAGDLLALLALLALDVGYVAPVFHREDALE
jgi:hypothetical protein